MLEEETEGRMIRVGINGFGRIGRAVLRRYFEDTEGRQNIRITHINDIADKESAIHLLKYDSVQGRFRYSVQETENGILIDGHEIEYLSISDPDRLDWKSMGVEQVIESTGRYTKRPDASKHLSGGAKRVIVTAPADGADITVVYGINHANIRPEHEIISTASCTTNCLAPLVYVIDSAFGLQSGFATTVHAYTADQKLVDSPHKDLRRARAAALSIIPTSTGAAKAIALVLPHLAGKIDGISIRVPTANVSLLQLTCVVSKAVSEKEVNASFQEAAHGRLNEIMVCTMEPLVSKDYVNDPHKAIVDLPLTRVTQSKTVTVSAWYDNEQNIASDLMKIVSYPQ
ncbi:MAG: type I glyceraldehyde-3-phosphate dehydrogenase [Holosporales bacterium]|jgi:glyceraldehyde 3-phosphate dehydrogenase|nr:type I glyceraldehyde-3-phosphate dehydrogenase [Holosporales bacterium]